MWLKTVLLIVLIVATGLGGLFLIKHDKKNRDSNKNWLKKVSCIFIGCLYGKPKIKKSGCHTRNISW